MTIFDKNYNRAVPTFANINLFGRCNIDCYFCLGKDLPQYFNLYNYNTTHFNYWKNFDRFLELCQNNNIDKLYITGQNTDPGLYIHLKELINFLQCDMALKVGLRTNGYDAIANIDLYNICMNSIGYSIISLNEDTNYKICGRRDIPDWNYILSNTKNCRVSIVVNRYNYNELIDIIKYVSTFENVKYIQVRRVSTDNRQKELNKDIEIFETVYNKFCIEHKGNRTEDYYGAEIFSVFGKNIVFWRTVKTSVNSYNYYVDGTISDEYFIIEGYLKHKKKIIIGEQENNGKQI